MNYPLWVWFLPLIGGLIGYIIADFILANIKAIKITIWPTQKSNCSKKR